MSDNQRTFIHPTAIIDPCVKIGKGCNILQGSVIGVHGLIASKDTSGRIIREWSTGGVIIEDNVDVGAGTIIERGHKTPTIIGKGTKIDVDCMIAHNCVIGENCTIVASTSIAGNTKIGSGSNIRLGCVIRNGLTIGKNVYIGMGSVVTKDIPDNMTVVGSPAMDIERFRFQRKCINSFSVVPVRHKIRGYPKRILRKIPLVRKINQKIRGKR